MVADTMRRAFALLKMGRPGPVMVEIPADVGDAEDAPEGRRIWSAYRPVKRATVAGANVRRRWTRRQPRCWLPHNPIVYAGQGVMHAEATDDLVELAELLQIPVTTSMAGKSGFPGDAPAVARLQRPAS